MPSTITFLPLPPPVIVGGATAAEAIPKPSALMPVIRSAVPPMPPRRSRKSRRLKAAPSDSENIDIVAVVPVSIVAGARRGRESQIGQAGRADPRGAPQSAGNFWGPGFLPAAFQGTDFNAT